MITYCEHGVFDVEIERAPDWSVVFVEVRFGHWVMFQSCREMTEMYKLRAEVNAAEEDGRLVPRTTTAILTQLARLETEWRNRNRPRHYLWRGVPLLLLGLFAVLFWGLAGFGVVKVLGW